MPLVTVSDLARLPSRPFCCSRLDSSQPSHINNISMSLTTTAHMPGLPGSDVSAEAGSSASAHAEVAQASLTGLELLEIQRLVDEEHWHNLERPDFHQRALAAQYSFPLAPSVASRPDSDTSSMAMAVSVQSLPSVKSALSLYSLSSHIPSLVSGPTAMSGPSIHTSQAASALFFDLLEEDSEGALREPENRVEEGLHCMFGFLGCSQSFAGLERWDTHCQSHLHGHLPWEVHCPFQCAWMQAGTSGKEAWDARMSHVRSVHQGVGVVETDRRPASTLISHLWKHRIIDDAQMKELRKHGRLTGNQIFLRSERSERRRRRREQLTGLPIILGDRRRPGYSQLLESAI